MATNSSLIVADPEIIEVIDNASGAINLALEILDQDYAGVIRLRMALKQAIARSTPIYSCALCGTPVYLVSRSDSRRFFFRHTLEDGRCPAKTRGNLSEEEINARKYNGAKESAAHFRIKEILLESMRRDPRFTEIHAESIIRGQDRKSWRKPDVQANFNGVPIIFEVQLSTTFLHVIAERREFYLQQGALLCWIFKSFEASQARLTQDDIFYNNNRNLFLASEETLQASKAEGTLVLDCRWAEPVIEDGLLATRWAGRLARFDELTQDQALQRIFLYDFDKERARVGALTAEGQLRKSFEDFWLNRLPYQPYDQGHWADLRFSFQRIGLHLPQSPDENRGPRMHLNALYSAREGRPIGWRFPKLIQVAHYLHDAQKPVLRHFGLAIKVYGRSEQLRSEDREGKWQYKVAQFKPQMAAHDPIFAPNQTFDDLLKFLFPEFKALNSRDGR